MDEQRGGGPREKGGDGKKNTYGRVGEGKDRTPPRGRAQVTETSGHDRQAHERTDGRTAGCAKGAEGGR